jgi:hypothetical protein
VLARERRPLRLNELRTRLAAPPANDDLMLALQQMTSDEQIKMDRRQSADNPLITLLAPPEL